MFREVMGSLWWPVQHVGLGFGPGGPERRARRARRPLDSWIVLGGLKVRARRALGLVLDGLLSSLRLGPGGPGGPEGPLG